MDFSAVSYVCDHCFIQIFIQILPVLEKLKNKHSMNESPLMRFDISRIKDISNNERSV